MSLKGLKAVILAGPDFEDLELFYPYYRLKEDGVVVEVVAPEMKPYQGKHGLEIMPDLTIDKADPETYDILVIPGGWAPDRLRRDKRVIEFVKKLAEKRAIIAAICHGPQILISANLLRGRKVTCVSAIKDDVRNAGAEYLDEPLVIDGELITSRTPRDLPDFLKGIIEVARKRLGK